MLSKATDDAEFRYLLSLPQSSTIVGAHHPHAGRLWIFVSTAADPMAADALVVSACWWSSRTPSTSYELGNPPLHRKRLPSLSLGS